MKREPLMDIFNAALAAVDPYRAVIRALRVENNIVFAGGNAYRLDAFDRIIVVGAGKAAAGMAGAVEDVLGEVINGGVIVVKYGHAGTLKRIEQIEAAHPIPDEAGVQGTQRIIDLVRRADERTLVICLLTGGGSSLLVAPLAGITLADKQRTTDLLLKAGASINELNAVRKHLSAVKGGRLAEAAYPAPIITIMLSDVIGDRIDVIASGPTVPDSTTFRDALAVVHKYSLERKIPDSVFSLLHLGVAGITPDTPKDGEAFFKKTRDIIAGNIGQALGAARVKAGSLGFMPEIITAELQGEARDAARFLAQTARRTRDDLKPGERRCLLSGGETTVTVRGKGKGGRNQELALAFADEIAGTAGIVLLSAGTDGTDGPTDAAGAIVDGTTARKARELGVRPETYLDDNDSYTFFTRLDSLSNEEHHIKTGPTGTNVMDLQIMLIEGRTGEREARRGHDTQ
jgi:glycerate 2-kinase